METTEILNSSECGYTYFITVGKTILGCGLKGGVQKLDILRVVIVQDNSVKNQSIWSKLGLTKDKIAYDVDADIYTADGKKIEIHSSEPKFLDKLMPYVWELKKQNPRIEFYGACMERQAADATKDVYTDTEQFAIMEKQYELEQQLYDSLTDRLATMLLSDNVSEIKIINLQKRILNSQKRLMKLSRQIENIRQNYIM